MSRRTSLVTALLVVTLAATGCRSASDVATDTGDDARSGTDQGQAQTETTSGAFGDLEGVCKDGDAKGAGATGVTSKEIQVGTTTDFGFSKNREFLDAADVFTAWCNDAGGINGRTLVSEPRDARLFEYRQRILEACKEDFALVGGGAAFDNTGTRDRLKCLLPEFPAQVVSYENTGSDLQVAALAENPKISPYEEYQRWLVDEAYPETKDAVGILAGDVGITRLFSQRETETMGLAGAKVVYNDVFPASGASDWTPYAQALKGAKVEGLIWLGQNTQLPKLMQAMKDIGYAPKWIDANSNAYNKEFIELSGGVLDELDVYAPLEIVPVEQAAQNPATQELVDLYKKYKPGATPTGPAVQAFSAWLLFASAATECGSELSRACVLEKASGRSEWTGGGLTAPTNPSDKDSTRVCIHVVKAEKSGWTSADFAPTDGKFRCSENTRLKSTFPKALTLEDVGVSADDLE